FTEELISWKKDKGSKIHDSTFAVNWTDFPVLNLHPHAWSLFNMIHLMGITFTPEGLELEPILPKDNYKFSSPIIGLEKSSNHYSGWYKPLVEGSWKITLKLKREEIRKVSSLEINGEEQNYIIENNEVKFSGISKIHKALSWKIIL
ncbi:MAG: hypothetical protein ACXACX_21930, partial [Candidatus Hodarchaeales archaeon]